MQKVENQQRIVFDLRVPAFDDARIDIPLGGVHDRAWCFAVCIGIVDRPPFNTTAIPSLERLFDTLFRHRTGERCFKVALTRARWQEIRELKGNPREASRSDDVGVH
jgi:hypothetical protein